MFEKMPSSLSRIFVLIAIALSFQLPAKAQLQRASLVDDAYSRLDVLRTTQPSQQLGAVTWDGGGATNNWSDAANWTGDSLPTSGDPVVFDATSVKNTTIDISVTTFNLTIEAGYTGTITMSPGVNASFGQTCTQAGGTFQAGSGILTLGNNGFGLNLSGGTLRAGSGPINFGSRLTQTGGIFEGGSGEVTGIFTLTGGTFVAPSGNLNVVNDATITNTFQHNNGTVTFIGANTRLNIPSSLHLNSLALSKNDGSSLTLTGGEVRITGLLNLVDGKLFGPGVLKAEGPVTIAPAFGNQDTNITGNGQLILKDGTGPRNIAWPGTASLPHMRIEDPSVTLTLSGPGPARSSAIWLTSGAIEAGSTDLEVGYNASTIDSFRQSPNTTFDIDAGDFTLVTGTFRQMGGTFTMDSGNASFPCFLTVIISGGTFDAPSGTTTMCADDLTLNGINGTFRLESTGIFNGRNGTFNINHRVEITGGSFNASSGTTRFGFVLAHSGGTFTHNGGSVIFDSVHPAYAISVPANPATNFNNVRFDLTALTPASVSVEGNFVVNGILTFANGSVTVGTLQAKSDIVVEASADGGNSALTFNGAGAQTYSNNGGSNTTGTRTVNKPSGILTAATDMILGTTQALNVTAGTFLLADGSDLTAGAITIAANGILASESASNATITLGAASTNNGRLDLHGGGSTCPQPPPDPIRLRSSVDGAQRAWSGTGIFNISDVDVKDMGGATNTTPAITVFNGTNSGNNRTNWTFTDACGVANRLGFVAQPSNTTAGQTITPSVQVAVQDEFGNTNTNATNSITIAIANNPGSGVLSGTVTRNAVNGIATFDNLSIDRSGDGYTLQATATTLVSATSSAFNINSGPGVKLGFITQPTDTVALQIMSPAVRVAIQDLLGNTVRNEVRVVNVSGGASFTNTSVETVNGVATFSNISSSAPGNDHILTARSSGLPNALSEPFDIIRPTLLVTNTNNLGPGSLRSAIQTAGLIFGHDNIHFNIPGTAPFRIAPQSPLPRLLDVTIDASTQPGFSGTPVVELDGTHVSSNVDNAGFIFESFSTVRGFVVNRYSTGAIIHGSANSLVGNYFGTDISGNTLLGGGSLLLEVTAQENDIGGTNNADRNVLAGGMHVTGIATRIGGNRIRGNYIGTNAAGTVGRNAGFGLIVVSSENEIGGTEPGAGNLISGNLNALAIYGNDNRIQGNRIGTDVNGTAAFPNQNQNGITISGHRNVIGGASASAANIIAFNRTGVVIERGDHNSIQRNSIHSNTGIAIDLKTGSFGPTPNDPRDDDEGSNRLLNFPVLDAASSSAGVTVVVGTTMGQFEFPTPLTLDFYSTPTCHSSGFGDLRSYVGSTVLPASGVPASFNVNLPSTPVGHFLVATATDANGNTSESSACRVIAPATVLISGRAVDNSGNPLAGAVVRLTGARTLNAVTTTSGDYFFPNLPSNSSYSVTATLSNYEFTPPSRTYIDVTGNQTGQNYSGTKTKFSVSGQVTAPSGIPLSHVTLVLSGTTSATTIVQSGVFRFNALPPGKYSLTAVKDGYTFTPPVAAFTISNADRTFNFTGAGTPLDGRIYFVGGGQVSTINADSGALGFVNNAYPSDSVAVSRDGRRIVFAKTTDANPEVRGLYISNADGSNAVRVVSGNNTTFNYHPEFSPDGTKVAFIQVSSGRRAIRILHPDGRVASVTLQQGPTNHSHPTWISNNRIAFAASDRNTGVSDIWVVNLDGTGWGRYTVAKDVDGSSVPAASPDGTKIVFRKKISAAAGGALVVIPSTGGPQTQIRSDAVLAKPAWSPDGTQVAYRQSVIGQPDKIAVVSATNGSNLRVVHTARPEGISWGPNYEFPTPVGIDVQVDSGGARVALAHVTAPGSMTFTTVAGRNLGTAPSGFVLSPSNAYHITTTAAFTAPATTCLKVSTYTASTQSAFDSLRVLHVEGGVFVDRTSLRNFTTRTICAETTTLGSFALATGPGSAAGMGGEAPSISGAVIDSLGNPIPDVQMSLSGTEDQLTQTDAFGNFTFPNLTANGSYVVQPQLLGYTFAENSHTFTNLTGENTVAFVGSTVSFAISGRITNLDSAPAAGVVVQLEGTSSDLAVTDASGDYSFEDLPASGTYSVTPLGEGFFNPRTVRIDQLTADASNTDFVHHANAPAFVAISGQVLTPGGQGIYRARVKLIGPLGETRQATTNPFGYFNFRDIEPGYTYSVEIAHKEYVFVNVPFEIYIAEDLANLSFISTDP